MRLRRWILIVPVIVVMGCRGERGSTDAAGSMSMEDRTAAEQSVRGFMGRVAQDVTLGGPTAWSKEFADGPDFFMASEGTLVFSSGAAAAQGIPALMQFIKKIELRWGQHLRVDPLTADFAVVGTSYQEVRGDAQGHEITEKGYFTGLAEKQHGTWKFRDAHWSVAPAAKAP
jgi:hypothetical protein